MHKDLFNFHNDYHHPNNFSYIPDYQILLRLISGLVSLVYRRRTMMDEGVQRTGGIHKQYRSIVGQSP